MHLLEITIFSLNNDLRQTYQNYEQPCQKSQNSELQSHFSVSKKHFCEEYTANAYRQMTDKLMFESVISTVR